MYTEATVISFPAFYPDSITAFWYNLYILHYTFSEFLNSEQGQVGWGFEQPGLAEGVPAHDRGLE